jgi:hypothetical protein
MYQADEENLAPVLVIGLIPELWRACLDVEDAKGAAENSTLCRRPSIQMGDVKGRLSANSGVEAPNNTFALGVLGANDGQRGLYRGG